MSLDERAPIVRRAVHLPERDSGASRFGVTVSPLFDETASCTAPSACSPISPRCSNSKSSCG